MFSISRFHEVMKGVSRSALERVVARRAAGKHLKGFSNWDHMLAMVYAQLSGASSLRELQAGFNAHITHHHHLGTSQVHRSTLSEANAKRDPGVFEEVARALMAQLGRGLREQHQAMLYLLDSTSLTLKGRGFDEWTSATRTRNTQGVKLHVLYAAHEQVPVQHSITAANVNDVLEGMKLTLTPGATYVFDKGYCSYEWWAQIDAAQALFVTRFKRNAGLRVLGRMSDAHGEVLGDERVEFAHRRARAGKLNAYTQPLRRVIVHRADHATPLVLATNDMHSSAERIAQLYKERWQIELFFKWIKQHLRLKCFLGRSANAVRIQLLCALIAYLLLALYRARQGLRESLWMVLAQLRATLFQRPATELTAWRRRRQRQTAFAALQPSLFS